MADPHCHIGRIWWKKDRLGRPCRGPVSVERRHYFKPGWLMDEIAKACAEIATWPEAKREQLPSERYCKAMEKRGG